MRCLILEVLYEGVISGGCFTKISRALQNILLKFAHCRNRTSFENSKLKFCTCAQSHALGIHWLWAHIQSFSLKFPPYMLIVILYFFARLFWGAREMLLKQSPGVFRESKVWFLVRCCYCSAVYNVVINLNALYSAAEIRSPIATHESNGRPNVLPWMVRLATNEFFMFCKKYFGRKVDRQLHRCIDIISMV